MLNYLSNIRGSVHIVAYFCDGYARRREISFKTVSKDLCEGVATLLLQLGVSCRISEIESSRHKTGDRVIESSEGYKITISGKAIELFRCLLPENRNGLLPPTDKSVTRPPVATPLVESGIKGLLSSDYVMTSPLVRRARQKKHMSRYTVAALLDEIQDTDNKVDVSEVRSIACADLGYDPVKSIDIQPYNGYVYDFSVPGDENFIGGTGNIILHNSGGQGFHNFNLFLSPYLHKLDYEEIKQLMQMFIYEMSQMIIARGAQAVFSSVQLVPGVPRAWRDVRAVYKGHISDKTYKDFEREVRLSYKAFIEVMLEGDYWGKPFNFPKPEIALMWEFMGDDWDKPLIDDCRPEIVVAPSYQELYKLTFELAAKQGTPYFDNQLPAYRDAEGGLNCFQCCAYNQRASARCDLNFNRKLHFVNGYHFDDMGSCQVVSLNLPRAAYRACRVTDDIRFRGMILKDRLEDLVDKAVEIFLEKRQYMRKAPLPFIRQMPKGPDGKAVPPLAAVDKLGFVIGLVGVNEMTQALTGKQLHEDRDAWLLALRIIEDLNTYVNQVSKDSGLKITLSRTPAETTAQRFAVCDLRSEEFKDRAMQVIKGDINAALRKAKDTNDLPVYYSNGTHLYVGAKDASCQPVTIFDRALMEGPFFPLVDGGNIFHIFLGEKDPDPEALMDFCLTLAKETNIGYFSVTKDMTVCKECHKVSPGLRATCPGCDSDNIDHISRITGYLQAVSGWNSAKRQELRDRNRASI